MGIAVRNLLSLHHSAMIPFELYEKCYLLLKGFDLILQCCLIVSQYCVNQAAHSLGYQCSSLCLKEYDMPYTLLMKHCAHCPWSDHWKHLSCDSKDHTARNSHMNNILHQLMHSGCPHLSLLHSALKPCSKVVSCISIKLLSSYKWQLFMSSYHIGSAKHQGFMLNNAASKGQ